MTDSRRHGYTTVEQPRGIRRAAGSKRTCAPSSATPSVHSAFMTQDIESICEAVYEEVRRKGVIAIALNSGIDRSALSRALRQDRGLKLATMANVLRALGYGLTVKVKVESRESNRLQAERLANLICNGFRSGDLDLAVAAMAAAVRSQDNISELARAADLSRENLYRSFAYPRSPRLSTVFGLLPALDLEVGVETMRRDPGLSQAVALRRAAT